MIFENLLSRIYIYIYPPLLNGYRLQNRENCIWPKKTVAITTRNSVNEGGKWNAQWTTLTVCHSLEVSDFDRWGYMGWCCIGFFTDRPWLLSWRLNDTASVLMESWCSNHAASILQIPKSTIATWWILDIKVRQVMLKFWFSHSFKQRILLQFPWPHRHLTPFLMAADCPRANII